MKTSPYHHQCGDTFIFIWRYIPVYQDDEARFQAMADNVEYAFKNAELLTLQEI